MKKYIIKCGGMTSIVEADGMYIDHKIGVIALYRLSEQHLSGCLFDPICASHFVVATLPTAVTDGYVAPVDDGITEASK